LIHQTLFFKKKMFHGNHFRFQASIYTEGLRRTKMKKLLFILLLLLLQLFL